MVNYLEGRDKCRIGDVRRKVPEWAILLQVKSKNCRLREDKWERNIPAASFWILEISEQDTPCPDPSDFQTWPLTDHLNV